MREYSVEDVKRKFDSTIAVVSSVDGKVPKDFYFVVTKPTAENGWQVGLYTTQADVHEGLKLIGLFPFESLRFDYYRFKCGFYPTNRQNIQTPTKAVSLVRRKTTKSFYVGFGVENYYLESIVPNGMRPCTISEFFNSMNGTIDSPNYAQMHDPSYKTQVFSPLFARNEDSIYDLLGRRVAEIEGGQIIVITPGPELDELLRNKFPQMKVFT